ncbi:hypothetical protein [Cyprinid herpesvirus 3]|uniref:Protein ORF10 n=1 Tax=Cyprinid herpesvirus 3 TaxID=180230 RepID=A3QMI2_CYHV3|nr:unnamed protein product [Cyprinid herpesvirus 3]ABF81796.1 hypothetical protein [Cyprinid herpesvirus 3]ABG42841.1 protein ORF10 [Cyprinid herpesvirus 3]AVL27472.1 protein ORF10 [Cyprinid herpesvirus 3]AVL27628.1 protein ORF10 [Cyprinid herpesvirus 3]
MASTTTPSASTTPTTTPAAVPTKTTTKTSSATENGASTREFEWVRLCGGTVERAPWTCVFVTSTVESLDRFNRGASLFSAKHTITKSECRRLNALWSALSDTDKQKAAWTMAGILDRCDNHAYALGKASTMPEVVKRCLTLCSVRLPLADDQDLLEHRKSTPLCARAVSLLAHPAPRDLSAEALTTLRTVACLAQLNRLLTVLAPVRPDVSMPASPFAEVTDLTREWIRWALAHYRGGKQWYAHQIAASNVVVGLVLYDREACAKPSQPIASPMPIFMPPSPQQQQDLQELELELAQAHEVFTGGFEVMDELVESVRTFTSQSSAYDEMAMDLEELLSGPVPEQEVDIDQATLRDTGLEAIHPCQDHDYPHHEFGTVTEAQADGHAEPVQGSLATLFGPVQVGTEIAAETTATAFIKEREDGTYLFAVPSGLIDVHYWPTLMQVLLQPNVPSTVYLVLKKTDMPIRRGTLRVKANASTTLQARNRCAEMRVPSGSEASGMLQMWRPEGLYFETCGANKPILRCPYHADEESADVPFVQMVRLCKYLRHINHWLDAAEDHSDPEIAAHVGIRRRQGLMAEIVKVAMSTLLERSAVAAIHHSDTPTPHPANMISSFANNTTVVSGAFSTPDQFTPYGTTPQFIHPHQTLVRQSVPVLHQQQQIPILDSGDALSAIIGQTLITDGEEANRNITMVDVPVIRMEHLQRLQQTFQMVQVPQGHEGQFVWNAVAQGQTVATGGEYEAAQISIADTNRYSAEVPESAREIMPPTPYCLHPVQLEYYDPKPVEGERDEEPYQTTTVEGIVQGAPLKRSQMPLYNKDPSCAFFIPMKGVRDPSEIPQEHYEDASRMACEYEERLRSKTKGKKKAFNTCDAMAYAPTHYAAQSYGDGPDGPFYHDLGNAFRYHERHFLPPLNNTYDTIKRRAMGQEKAPPGARSIDALVTSFWATHPNTRVFYDELVTLVRNQNSQPEYLKQYYAHANLNPSPDSPAALKLTTNISGDPIKDGLTLFFLAVEYFGHRPQTVVWWARTKTLGELLTDDYWARFITMWGCWKKMIVRLAGGDMCANVRNAVRAHRHVGVEEFHKKVTDGLQAVTRMHTGVLPFMGDRVEPLPQQPVHLRPYTNSHNRSMAQSLVDAYSTNGKRTCNNREPVVPRKQHAVPFFLPDKTLMLALKQGHFMDEYAFVPIRAAPMRDKQSLGFDPKSPSNTCNREDNAATMNLTNIVFCKNTNQEIGSNNNSRRILGAETRGLAQCEADNLEPRITNLPCEPLGALDLSLRVKQTPYPDAVIFKTIQPSPNPTSANEHRPDPATCSFVEITAYMEPQSTTQSPPMALSTPSPRYSPSSSNTLPSLSSEPSRKRRRT